MVFLEETDWSPLSALFSAVFLLSVNVHLGTAAVGRALSGLGVCRGAAVGLYACRLHSVSCFSLWFDRLIRSISSWAPLSRNTVFLARRMMTWMCFISIESLVMCRYLFLVLIWHWRQWRRVPGCPRCIQMARPETSQGGRACREWERWIRRDCSDAEGRGLRSCSLPWQPLAPPDVAPTWMLNVEPLPLSSGATPQDNSLHPSCTLMRCAECRQ